MISGPNLTSIQILLDQAIFFTLEIFTKNHGPDRKPTKKFKKISGSDEMTGIHTFFELKNGKK